MQHDMICRLKLDPDTRTLGELLHEREWAIHEIERLRRKSIRATRWDESSKAALQAPPPTALTP